MILQGQIVPERDLKATIRDGWVLKCGCLHLQVKRSHLQPTDSNFVTIHTPRSKGCDHA